MPAIHGYEWNDGVTRQAKTRGRRWPCWRRSLGLILFAGFFAPYDFAAQDRDQPFAPPTALHFVDAQGNFHIRPFIYNLDGLGVSGGVNQSGFWTHPYPVHFFVHGTPYKIAGVFASRVHLFGVEAPGRIFLMGSDAYGRDQFSRFLMAVRSPCSPD